MRPRLLDLFCGAGGAAEGYRRAGFDVTGVDCIPQPNYPFSFERGDVMMLGAWMPGWWRFFDAVHASPPCHAYSTVSGRALKGNRQRYPDLIAPVREMLRASGLPYVIENVVGAPLLDPARYCGSSFGLDVRRHRLFESSFDLAAPPCDHSWQTPRFRSLDSRRGGRLASVVGVHGHLNYPGEKALREKAMGVDWMTTPELAQAIPPAYTEHIGRQLITHLERAAA